MAATEALINAPEFTVTELSSALKRTVEDAYGHVRVRGEISGFRGPHSSGHCYFALKDDGAKIEAVIWKFAHARMRFKPQEGLEVIATGKLTTYPGSSKYQIVIEALEPAAVGHRHPPIEPCADEEVTDQGQRGDLQSDRDKRGAG